jgi:hypothetical protein
MLNEFRRTGLKAWLKDTFGKFLLLCNDACGISRRGCAPLFFGSRGLAGLAAA